MVSRIQRNVPWEASAFPVSAIALIQPSTTRHPGNLRNVGPINIVGVKKRLQDHSSIRSRVEHLFRAIKCQFDYTQVLYQCLAKNAAQVFMLAGLANFYLKRRPLLA